MCTAAAVSVSVHITIRQTSPKGPRLARRKAGVAVPAIRKKIIAWSSRCSRRRQAAVQLPRWYSALTPNKALTLAAYIAAAVIRVAPCARASSSVPITTDISNQTRCSQPRRTGFV
jgi:hypothetical protein